MNNIEILEKELANINNLIDYYTFENLDYDKKYRMEEFKKAIENLIKDNEFLNEWFNFYKNQQAQINKKIREILNISDNIETLEALDKVEKLIKEKRL